MSELYSCKFYEKNDEETIKKYINENKDVLLIPDQGGMLPIYVYCWSKCEKSIEIINLLINNDPNNLLIPDNCGYLPIHYYCLCDCKKLIEIINLLINNNPNNLLIPDKRGYLPIHWYCISICEKSKEIINLLINNNPNNLLIPNNNGNLPIYIYCSWNTCKKSIEIIDYLLYIYDINKIDDIINYPTYVGYYLYKIYNWRYYNKELFLHMLISKLQRLIKVYLIKRKLC